jgi:DNA-binding transcriptional ArsR family regulator
VLHALGDPVRLELVHHLALGGESTCPPAGMDVPKSTLSNHWRILREAGLTTKAVTPQLRGHDIVLEDPTGGQVTTMRADARLGIRQLVALTSPSRCDWTRAVAKYVPGWSQAWVVDRSTARLWPSTFSANG